MNISYEYYRIFYYVAKYKNVTQAAQALHNNQPNISRILKQLEHELGCTLLIRSNRGITLTPEGEQLYSHIRIAVEQIQAAENAIQQATLMQSGSVTIGASETALRILVLPILKEFKRLYPDIRIRIRNHLTSQAVESVRNGIVDFSVVVAPANIEKPLVAYPIMTFQDILIGGSAFSSRKDKVFTLKEIQSYPFVCLGEGTMTYQFYDAFYQLHHVDWRPELEAATTDQIVPMVKNNLGIGYIPEIYVQDALENHEVCRLQLAEEIPTREICFVENTSKPLSIAAAALKELLIKQPGCNG